MGMEKVYIPKTRLLELFFLKSAISISSPAKNIIYGRPTVPKSTILLSLAMKLNPKGPMIIPAMIRPMRCGMDNLFNSKGTNNMINRIRAKIRTGSDNGKVNPKVDSRTIFATVMIDRKYSRIMIQGYV